MAAVSRSYIWAYASFQFAIVILFAHIFYNVVSTPLSFYTMFILRDFDNSVHHMLSMHLFKCAAQCKFTSLGAPFLLHWFWNCNQHKFASCGVSEVEGKPKPGCLASAC